MGTGSSRGPRLRGSGGANVQLGQIRPRMNIFSGSPPKVFSVGLRSVPVCFGVIRKLMQHPLGVCGVLKRGNECASRGECCSPSFPSGKVLSSIMEVLFTPFLRLRRARRRPLKVYAVLKLVLRMKSPDMGVLFPLLPFGTPPPLRHSTCSPSRRRKLRRSSIARLLLFPFLFHKGATAPL